MNIAASQLLAELLPVAWLAGAAALLAWLVDRPLARRQRHGLRAALWSLVLLRLVLPADLGAPTGLAAALVPAGLDSWLTAPTADDPSRHAAADPAHDGPAQPGGAAGATDDRAGALAPRELLRRAGQLTGDGDLTAATPRVVLPALALAAARLDPSRAGAPSSEPDATAATRAGPDGRTDHPASPARPAWPLLLLAVWGAGSLALLAWALMVSRRHRRRLRAAALASRPAGWEALLDRITRRAGLDRRPTVVVSDAAAGPALVGAIRPLIVLSPEAPCLPARDLELVLLHEACHLRRRDTAVAALTWLAAALWWWHPGAWLARRRLAGLRELACDARVVACLDGRRADYGAALLAAADLSRRGPSLPAVGGATGAGRSERVGALLSGPRPGHRGRALVLAAGLALLAGSDADAAATPAMPVTPSPAPAPAPAPTPTPTPSVPADRRPPAPRTASRADVAAPDPAALLQGEGCLIPHLAAAALAARSADARSAPGREAPASPTDQGPAGADDPAAGPDRPPR